MWHFHYPAREYFCSHVKTAIEFFFFQYSSLVAHYCYEVPETEISHEEVMKRKKNYKIRAFFRDSQSVFFY